MRRNVEHVVSRSLGIALLIGATAAVAQTQGSPEADFKKLAADFAQAWLKGDAKAIAAMHTKDAVRLAGNGQPAVAGTAAIEKGLAEAFAGPYKGTTLTITPNTYTRVSADTYVGEGTYQLTGGTPPPGVPLSGQYLNTMVRQGGRWLIAAAAVMPAPVK